MAGTNSLLSSRKPDTETIMALVIFGQVWMAYQPTLGAQDTPQPGLLLLWNRWGSQTSRQLSKVAPSQANYRGLILINSTVMKLQIGTCSGLTKTHTLSTTLSVA